MENNGKRNRRAGHSYERQIAQELKLLGWEKAATSRAESRSRDAEGVDLVNTDPMNIQCKYTKNLNYAQVLSDMPEDHNYNVIFHKKKRVGEYAILSKNDFLQIVEMLKNEGVF